MKRLLAKTLVFGFFFLGQTALAQHMLPESEPAPYEAPTGQLGPRNAGAPRHNPSNPIDWQIIQNPKESPFVILFDRSRQVLAVYQIDTTTGSINLTSVRKVAWDLDLQQHNTNKPTPLDISQMHP